MRISPTSFGYRRLKISYFINITYLLKRLRRSYLTTHTFGLWKKSIVKLKIYMLLMVRHWQDAG